MYFQYIKSDKQRRLVLGRIVFLVPVHSKNPVFFFYLFQVCGKPFSFEFFSFCKILKYKLDKMSSIHRTAIEMILIFYT